MKRLYTRIASWFDNQWLKIKPGRNAIAGASKALLVSVLLLWIYFTIKLAFTTKDAWISIFGLIILILVVLGTFLAIKVLRILNLIPKKLKVALLIAFPLLFISLQNGIIALLFAVVALAIGATVYVINRTGFRSLTTIKKSIVVLGALVGIVGLSAAVISYSTKGYEMDKIINAANLTSENVSPITLESPAKPGTYTVKELTYGSGNDKRRVAFAKDVDIKTESVNGVAFIDSWDGISGWARETFWGFDSKALPINGRVWYPEGEGPFPLVLIVHGNHIMSDYSDVGYGYLGELMASRGIIFASVDENFINGGWTDFTGGIEEENDARGWLLLEHLKVWHEWNNIQENPFYNKIDTDNIALIGHSRGGEAVAHAAMFNNLTHYPDDASIPLGYNFNIKSIIAIAPVDGQYKPGNSSTKFENVDYFVLHGSQDGDVRSYMGSQQYERIKFTDSLYHVKTGLYVYGANHGQFNSSWGNNDIGSALTGLLNLKQLLSEEDQQQVAKVFISAFLEATLKGEKGYLPLFVDARKGKDWLPETIYLNQFQDSESEFVCNFDEDFDVLSPSKKGKITSEGLTVWREEEIQLKWQKKGSRAVVLGWNVEDDGEETNKKTAMYAIELDSTAMDINQSDAFIFSMAESTEDANPKTKGKWVNNENEDEETEDEEQDEEDVSEDDDDDDDDDNESDSPKEPIDFSIQFTDSNDQKITFLLSDFSALQREIETVVMKVDFITGDKESEKIFQTFYFPMDSVLEKNPDFNVSGLAKISFLFNKTESAVVVIDDIGFTKMLE